MKKERFEYAELEVIEFEQTDIIITSDEEDPYEGDKAYIAPSLF